MTMLTTFKASVAIVVVGLSLLRGFGEFSVLEFS